MSTGAVLLTHRELHLLSRAVEAGTANAAAALSQMFGRDIQMVAGGLRLAPLGELVTIAGRPDHVMIVVYLGVTGNLKGHMLFLFHLPMALHLADILLDRAVGTTTALGEMERSALGEAGNVAGSFFLNALGDMARLVIHPSPPVVLEEMIGAVLDGAIGEISLEVDEILIVDTALLQGEQAVSGHFLVIPTPSSLRRLLDRLKESGLANDDC